MMSGELLFVNNPRKLLLEAENGRMYSMSASQIETMGSSEQIGENAAGFIAKLQEMKAALDQLNAHQNVIPPELKAQRILETQNQLDGLAREIEIAKQGAAEWKEAEAWAVEKEVARTQVALTEKSPFLVKKLLYELRTGTDALAKKIHEDPGPGLKALEQTATIPGKFIAPMAVGGAAATGLATSIGASAFMTGAATIGGAISGGLILPAAVEGVTSLIKDPGWNSMAKTALYAGIAIPTALFVSGVGFPIAVAAGINGVINAIQYIQYWRSRHQGAPEVQVDTRAQEESPRVAVQPS